MPPTRCLLLLALLALQGCGSDELFNPTLPDPTPFHAAREVRLNTGTGGDLLEVGVPVALVWDADELALRSWTLAVPAGSGAMLSDPTAPRPTFVPDIEGEYLVGLTTTLGGTILDVVERRFFAATYLGRAACATCHVERAAAAAATSHGTTLERRAADLFSVTGCLTCHVVGSDVNGPVSAGGFDDEAAQVGFDPKTYVFTDYATFAADFPTLADRGAVQCENCHGPGSLHVSDPRRTSISTDAGLCGACHNTYAPRYRQWQLSVHAAPPPTDTVNNPACANCHTARGFARSVAGLVFREQNAGEPGVTCAACHDPHSAANLSEVRLFGNVTLGDGSIFDAGRAAPCATCHQAGVADAADYATQGGPFPCAVQTDMVAGHGAIEYGLVVGASFHGDPGFKPRNLTGNPNDPLFPEACVTCHMAPTPATPPLADRLGEHTWRLREGTIEHAAGNCDRCHPGLTTFDRPLGHDFDGNGIAEGVQTEVKGLIEILFGALVAADTQGGLSAPGGSGTPIIVSDDLSLTTPELRQAAYNYNFVVTDGSFGVHNTVYAVQLLQRTYEQVTGVPFATDFPMAYIP